jgi:hypothetical protein
MDTTHQASCDTTRGGACSCPAGDPRRQLAYRPAQVEPDGSGQVLLVGQTWDGTEVLVRVFFRPESASLNAAARPLLTGEIAFREDTPRGRWGIPGTITEEAHG